MDAPKPIPLAAYQKYARDVVYNELPDSAIFSERSLSRRGPFDGAEGAYNGLALLIIISIVIGLMFASIAVFECQFGKTRGKKTEPEEEITIPEAKYAPEFV